MKKKTAYSVHKIIHHPELLERMRRREQGYPIQIHFMPQNKCNQNCSFCAYRLDNYKNSKMFNDRECIPREKMLEILADAKAMGVRAFEVTGGGEPLIYPYREEMFEKMIEYGFDIGLVTNGTALTEDLAKLIGPHLTWARVSIDAGTSATYSLVREVDEKHFDKGLNAIRLLSEYCTKPDVVVGAGFVVNNENHHEILQGVKVFKEIGADNVRISAAYTGKGVNYYKDGAIKEGQKQAREAVETLDDDIFTVYNLFDERIQNLEEGVQDYSYCGTKEILCVIGGDMNVYTCCSLAFNPNGLIGSIENRSFKELYDSDMKHKFFDEHKPCNLCKIPCLYETRNKFMLYAIDEEPQHKNFI